MRLYSPLLHALVALATGNSLLHFTDYGNSSYYLSPGLGVDTAADPPVRRPPPPLPNRRFGPASDDVWNKCRDKGCTLAWAMQANDADVGPAYNPQRDTAKSPFGSVNDLRTWGWFPYPSEKIDESFHNFYSTWGIGEALVGLGVSEYSDIYEGGENRVFSIDHRSWDPAAPPVDEQRYAVGGKDYRATGASYGFAINPKDGVILGMNRVSPQYAANDRTPPVARDQMPALNQFSDVAWIGWDSVNTAEGTDVTALCFCFAVGIVNLETKSVIRRALDAKGWVLSPWPGHIFERQWFETRAIIGTPNVQGFAYLLIQHKHVLGNMFIDKVQVFESDTASRNPSLVVHISKPKVQDKKLPRDSDPAVLHAVRAKL